jgi:hypothetical protein
MPEIKEAFWVYLHKSAVQEFTAGSILEHLVAEDSEDDPYFPCVTLKTTDFGFLSLGVIIDLKLKDKIVIDIMIPPHWVKLVIGGDAQKKIGFVAKPK